MDYLLLKSVHMLGVVLFLDNIIVTAAWKAMADRDGGPNIRPCRSRRRSAS